MNTLVSRLLKAHDAFFHGVDYLQSPFLLAVRLYWGWQFAQSGWGKLHHLADVTQFFASLNLPAPATTALFISCLEFFGGIALAIGLFSRFTAFVMTINMVMAYVTADREALFSVFSDPDKFYAAAPYTFLIACLIILIFGPGKLCVDFVLRRYFKPRPAQQN